MANGRKNQIYDNATDTDLDIARWEINFTCTNKQKEFKVLKSVPIKRNAMLQNKNKMGEKHNLFYNASSCEIINQGSRKGEIIRETLLKDSDIDD